MNSAATQLVEYDPVLRLDKSAFTLIETAKGAVDYDQDPFAKPESRRQLLDLASEVISSPEKVPSTRKSAYNLFSAFDKIVERGLWQEREFEVFAANLLNNSNPRVKAIFIDCLSHSHLNNSYYSEQLLNRHPNLLTQILDAAISVNSQTALVQAVNIFARLGRSNINQADCDKLLSAIEKNPGSEILAEAAILFSDKPNQKFTQILHKNFKTIDNFEFNDQSVLRYMLNHSPSAEVVKKTMEVGLQYRTEYDKYPGNTGLLEAALYLSRHRQDIGLSLMGLGNLFDMLTNRSLSPTNYSDKAALRYIARNLKLAQPEYAIEFVFKALGASQNPLALRYLDKVSNVPGFLQKAVNTITLSWSNICSNHFRLRSALKGLQNNTCDWAQELKEKLALRSRQKIAVNFLGW